MRISASGLVSTIDVAIDQIFRLAPSISGPIEPVVSSTKPTSTTGLAAACVATTNGTRKTARANALASLANMIHPSKWFSDGAIIFLLRGGRGPGLRLAVGGLAAACFAAGPRKIGAFAAPGAADLDKSTAILFRAERTFMSRAMKVDGKPTRTIWLEADGATVGMIDQTVLPHRYATLKLATLDDAARAISTMQVRGAPLIGAAAAYGMCLALRADASDEAIERAYAALIKTRPTAINLKWALDEMVAAVRNRPRGERVAAAYQRAAEICDEDVAINQAIGRHGLKLIEDIAAQEKAGRAGQRAHPLQRRLARDRRRRHRHGADLPRARQGREAPRLGR